MPFYTKKPVTIEAERFPYEAETNAEQRANDIYKWIEKHIGPFKWPEDEEQFPFKGVGIDPESGLLHIATLEGVMRVDRGDFVIKGVKGEFYPCKPDIFYQTYDRKSDHQSTARL